MKKLLMALILFLSGCCQNKLTVFTEYLSIETLPSYIVGTPDPRLYDPDVGEKLHIKWDIPKEEFLEQARLKLSLYFGNKTEKKLWIDLPTPNGIYIYPLINADYWEKQGILTYKVELFSGDSLIDTWQHLLYTERIQISDE